MIIKALKRRRNSDGKKLRYVFDRKDKIKLVGLAILMVIGSVLELLAVAVFNPFIEVLMQTSSIEDDSF
ncbi:MAG: hypothetical protein ACLR8X_08180 [Gallintestinimicrobium sp.]